MGHVAEYEDKVHELKGRFKTALDNLMTVYPRYKINPGFPSYARSYAEAKGELDHVESELTSLRYNAQDSTNDMANHIEKVDSKIIRLTEENKKLGARNDVLVGAKNASVGQMESYRDDYRNNVFTLLALLTSGTIVAKIIF